MQLEERTNKTKTTADYFYKLPRNSLSLCGTSFFFQYMDIWFMVWNNTAQVLQSFLIGSDGLFKLSI